MTAYIIKSSLSLLLLFGIYWLILRKEKLFRFNRFFLVASVLFSLIVPFISVPVNLPATPGHATYVPVYSYNIPDILTDKMVSSNDVNPNQQHFGKQPSKFPVSAILISLYCAGMILFLIRFLRNLYIILQKSRLSEKIRFNGYRIILISDNAGPCCFFYNIFLNREDYLNGRIDRGLLDHELEHVRQSHTADIILMELVKIFYWFNPVHLLYDRAIRLNHEYLADNGVITENYDLKSYIDKMFGFITGRTNISLTSGSNKSFTKMRLLMLMKSGSGKISKAARISATLTMGIIIFLLLSAKASTQQLSPLKQSETGQGTTQDVVRGIVLTEGGKPLVGATIKTAGSANIPPRVTGNFEDGRFTVYDLQPGATLLIEYPGFKGQTIKADFGSEMVIRLVRDPDYKGKILIPEIQNVNFRNSDFTSADALAVIDGTILDHNMNLKVNPAEIKSFSVLTGPVATKKYGDKGKDGVIEIILYQNKTGPGGKKQFIPDNVTADSSKYIKYLGINHVTNKGETIDIPVSNLQYVSVWTYHDIDNNDKKELRSIAIMTRDYFKVKGRVVRENGKPLPGVKVSASDNPVTVTSDKEGRFMLEDVKENALLEFSHPGFKSYYLSTLYEVAFNEDLTIELRKDNFRNRDDL